MALSVFLWLLRLRGKVREIFYPNEKKVRKMPPGFLCLFVSGNTITGEVIGINNIPAADRFRSAVDFGSGGLKSGRFPDAGNIAASGLPLDF